MASEIMRVCKRWFVTTPNRWYPFEFHIRLPFITWLPFHGYLKIGQIICYNHVKKKYVFGQKIDHLRLMTANELRMCFPGSQIIKQRVTFMPETLIAIGEKVQFWNLLTTAKDFQILVKNRWAPRSVRRRIASLRGLFTIDRREIWYLTFEVWVFYRKWTVDSLLVPLNGSSMNIDFDVNTENSSSAVKAVSDNVNGWSIESQKS